jgi:hypothetical protein
MSDAADPALWALVPMPPCTSVPPVHDLRDAAAGHLIRTLSAVRASLAARPDTDRIALRGLLSVLRHPPFPMLVPIGVGLAAILPVTLWFLLT